GRDPGPPCRSRGEHTMMTMMTGGTLVAAALLLATSSAGAGELNSVFDLSLRWGDGGVTLGGRIDSPLGPTSGTVTGRMRPDRLPMDGWLDDRGQTWTFELDANFRDGLRAVIRRPPQRI